MVGNHKKTLKNHRFLCSFWHVGKIASKRQLDLQNDQLGTNLGPTWVQLVPKMEPRRARMEPSWAKMGSKWTIKSDQMGCQNDIKKTHKIKRPRPAQAGRSQPGPLKTFQSSLLEPPDNLSGHSNTP